MIAILADAFVKASILLLVAAGAALCSAALPRHSVTSCGRCRARACLPFRSRPR